MKTITKHLKRTKTLCENNRKQQLTSTLYWVKFVSYLLLDKATIILYTLYFNMLYIISFLLKKKSKLSVKTKALFFTSLIIRFNILARTCDRHSWCSASLNVQISTHLPWKHLNHFSNRLYGTLFLKQKDRMESLFVTASDL